MKPIAATTAGPVPDPTASAAATTATDTRRSPGRPRVYRDAADRQRAYRARLAAKGLRIVRRIERVVPPPLKSSIIDLSECREAWAGRR